MPFTFNFLKMITSLGVFTYIYDMNTKMQRLCAACKKPLEGRKDKIYCDRYCKSSFQYKQIQNNKGSFHQKIIWQLRKNKKILKKYNKAGKATIRKADLLADGFNPNIFTHYWRSKKGNVYLFVFEYGFMRITENNKTKYSLILWQKYMRDQIWVQGL